MERISKRSTVTNNRVALSQTINVSQFSIIKNILRVASVLAGLLFSGSLFAQSIVVQATEFREWWNGHAPFYIDSERQALGVDTSVVAHRGKFAFAETWFQGGSGVYDLTLVTLGDVNGENEYRIKVNGEIVGRSTNARVNEDWTEQTFLFENIELHKGYTVTVEAKTFTNESVTENGEFTFSSGLWRSLEFTLDEDATVTNPHDVVFVSSRGNADGSVTFNMRNNHALSTATGNVFTATAADNTFYHFITKDNCGCNLDTVVCNIPDLAPLETYSIDVVVAERYVTPYDQPITTTIVDPYYGDTTETEYGTSTTSLNVELTPGIEQNFDNSKSWSANANWIESEPIDVAAIRTFTTCEGPDFSTDPNSGSDDSEADTQTTPDSFPDNGEPETSTDLDSSGGEDNVTDSSPDNSEAEASTDTDSSGVEENSGDTLTDVSDVSSETEAPTNPESSDSDETDSSVIPNAAEANGDTSEQAVINSSGGGAGLGLMLLLILGALRIPWRVRSDANA